MSDYLQEFLDDPFDMDTSGDFPDDIALVRYNFAYTGGSYDDDTLKYFTFMPDNNSSVVAAKEECQQYITSIKMTGKNAFPKLGILIEIPVDTFLTAHEALSWDIVRFVNSYSSAKYQMGEKGKLSEEQQQKVNGLLPYDMLIEMIKKFPQCLGEFVWAKLTQEINQHTEAIESKNQSGYPYRVYVIKEILPGKEAAYKVADVESSDSDEFADFGGNTSGLSDFAVQEGKWTIEKLKDQWDSIFHMIADTEKITEGPNGEEMTSELAREIVCEGVKILPEDLKLLEKILLDEVPF